MNPSISHLWLQWTGLFAMEVAVVIAMAGLCQCFISAPSWRRTIWQMVFVGILALSILEMTGLAGKTRAARKVAPPRTTLAAAEPAAPNGVTSPGELSSEFRREVERRRQSAISPSQATAGLEPASQLEPASTSIWVRAGALIWVSGTIVLLGRLLLGHGIFLLQRRRGIELRPEVLTAHLQPAACGLGLRRQIRLREVPRLSGPVAFGIFRGAIGLPANFTTKFPAEQQQVMLAHEMAHLAARDPAWQLLGDVMSAVWWWHPLVWWARRQLHVASETAADETSLLFREGPNVLAECLVTLANQLHRPGSNVTAGIAGGFRSNLGKRVERLLAISGKAWCPPRRRLISFVKPLGSAAVLAAALYSTAWAAPQAINKGNMKTSHMWKGPFAAAFLFLAVDSWSAEPSKPDAAKKLQPAPAANPTPAAPTTPPAKDATGNPEVLVDHVATIFQDAGFEGADGRVVGELTAPSSGPNRMHLQKKLEQIVLPEFSSDGLPLEEVVRMLSVEAAKRDPERRGINFILNARMPAVGSIDPTTGLPIPAQEPIDLASLPVSLRLPLKNMRLSDVLDVITRIASPPIQYTLEEYGVVIAPTYGTASQPVPLLETRIFRVQPDLFFRGMEKAFGVKIPREATPQDNSAPSSRKVLELKLKQAEANYSRLQKLVAEKLASETDLGEAQIAVEIARVEFAQSSAGPPAPSQALQQKIFRDLLAQLGVKLEPPKSVFYNELTGTVMVRVTSQEMEVVQAAMETLGSTQPGMARQ